MWLHMGGVQTPLESLHWKLTLGEKSLAAPGNQTCIGNVPVWCSTNWATSPHVVLFLFFFLFFLSGVSVCLYFTLTTTSSVKHLHLDFLSCSVKKNSFLNLFYVWCAVQMCLCINCATCTWSVTAPEVVLVMHTMYRKCLLPFSCWLATLWH